MLTRKAGYVHTFFRHVHVKNQRADDDRPDHPNRHRVQGAADVGAEIRPERIDRPQQIGGDIPRAYSIGQVRPAPDRDHSEQALADPHETNQLLAAVAGHRARGAGDGQHHVTTHETENRVGEKRGHGGLPVGGEAPKPGADQRRRASQARHE
ncbi:hypothetical protein [Fodinicola feengrottensis]|uniref:hypothetical protein n=1 Tax=Fodinicola feengrottensis TaxID=435914 RepID=UPI002441E899|nr:hypothetical protein [Fodinicola feengrottensis]